MKRLFVLFFTLLLQIDVQSALIREKVLICGVCKNIERAVPNIIQSSEHLGRQFLDYRVVIYENNSTDRTKELLREWAKSDPHVLFISEDLTKKEMAKQIKRTRFDRVDMIARARNIVLDEIMRSKYQGFKYVVWADLDLQDPWDVEQIVETIVRPEQEWDGVFANGEYDLLALRDPEFPIGFELIGEEYWQKRNEIRSRLVLDPKGPWRKVYSAFGGMGIYQRESIKGCRYSGVVTRDMEQAVMGWLKEARLSKNVCFLEDYDRLLSSAQVIDLNTDHVSKRKLLPDAIGVRMHNAHGIGKVVWFSCTLKSSLPWTCEHIPFHASMARRGHGKFYINPRWKSEHP